MLLRAHPSRTQGLWGWREVLGKTTEAPQPQAYIRCRQAGPGIHTHTSRECTLQPSKNVWSSRFLLRLADVLSMHTESTITSPAFYLTSCKEQVTRSLPPLTHPHAHTTLAGPLPVTGKLVKLKNVEMGLRNHRSPCSKPFLDCVGGSEKSLWVPGDLARLTWSWCTW